MGGQDASLISSSDSENQSGRCPLDGSGLDLLHRHRVPRLVLHDAKFSDENFKMALGANQVIMYEQPKGRADKEMDATWEAEIRKRPALSTQVQRMIGETMRERMRANDLFYEGLTGPAAAERIQALADRYRTVIQSTGMKME